MQNVSLQQVLLPVTTSSVACKKNFFYYTDEVEKMVDSVGNLEEEDETSSAGDSEEEDETSSAGDSEEEDETSFAGHLEEEDELSFAGHLEEEDETNPRVQQEVGKIVSE